jgi:predicted Ser/Thr protein kinase
VTELAEGTEFAGCNIVGVLGRGGMGIVYRATDVHLRRPVAIKLITADRAGDPAFRERFEREARVTASIDHPNVIPVYAAGEEDGHLYLVMRYVDGTDLQALLRRDGRLEPRRAAAIVAQVAAALDAAHAAGLVHRDVKPANVLLSDGHVYLSDFGLTRPIGSDTRLTDSGEWIGTVDFMAPEHLGGRRTDARSDVYALGCVLFATLTGAPPFRRDTAPQTIVAHLNDPPPRPSATPGVPAAFDAVIARALAKDPQDRYQSAGDLGRAALAAAAGEPEPEPTRSVARGPAAPADAPTRIAPDGTVTRAAPTEHAPTEFARPPRTTTPPPELGRTHRPRRRRALLAVALGLALAAGAVTALALALGGDGTSSGPLSEAEVRRAADRFARAYANEDARTMTRILSADVQRVSPGDVQRGRRDVVAEYRRQFADSDVQDYQLTDLQVEGGRVGRASGRYVVERKGRPVISGRVVFGVERIAGRSRIGLIANEPRG